MSASLLSQRKHLLAGQSGKPAVARIGCHAEVHGPVPLVSVPGCHQRLHFLDHVRHELRRPRRVRRGRHADGPHGPLEGRHLALGQLAEVDSPFVGHAQHVVVHVGDVLYVDHVGSEVPEVPHEHVEVHVGEGVPEMGGVVRRDPAHINTHTGPDLHLAELAGLLVEQTHRD